MMIQAIKSMDQWVVVRHAVQGLFHLINDIVCPSKRHSNYR